MHFELERMIRKAQRHAEAGYPIPLDLAMQLAALGVDVNDIERNPHG